MAIGTVKWFNPAKRFGFIRPDEGKEDIFVHVTALEKAGLSHLDDGVRIEYDLEQRQDGKTSAVNLKLLDA